MYTCAFLTMFVMERIRLILMTHYKKEIKKNVFPFQSTAIKFLIAYTTVVMSHKYLSYLFNYNTCFLEKYSIV